MPRLFRHPDIDAHEPGCTKVEAGEPYSDPNSAYIDVFCDCHRYTDPKILMNRTDIAWPAGWTEVQAHDWRARHGLLQPNDDLASLAEAKPRIGLGGESELTNPS
jgi:hypothetical protein